MWPNGRAVCRMRCVLHHMPTELYNGLKSFIKCLCYLLWVNEMIRMITVLELEEAK